MWLVSFVLIINMCKCGWLCLLIVNWSSSNFGHALKILNLRLNNVQVSITCVILLAWRRINLDLILFSLLSLHHRSTLLCTPEVMYLGHVTSNSRRTETETKLTRGHFHTESAHLLCSIEMGLGNILLLTQVVAYLVSFIVSFFIFIPIATNVKEFNGHCLLYADGTFDDKTKELTHISWGRDSACGFNIFMGVIVMLLSLFYMVWESVYLFKNIDGYV